MSAQLTTFNDVCTRRVARHEDVRFETGPGSIGSQRAACIAGAGQGELGCTKMFSHGYGHAHTTGLETLRWICRFVLDPEIDVAAKFLSGQQWCSTFA